MKEPKLHLSILPNLISDCASVFMEYKKMKIDNDQFNKKCRIIDNSLQSQMKNQRESIELNYRQKMQEINANKTTKLFELEAEKEVSLSKIEYRTRKALEEISSNERMQIAKLKIDYEIKRKAQEDELYKFRENLKEDSRRFDKKYEMVRSEQTERHKFIGELQTVCRHINKKIVKGRASTRDMEYCKHIMNLQIALFNDGMSITQSLRMIYSGEDVD